MKFDLGHINKIVAVSVKIEGAERVMHYQVFKLKKGEVFLEKQEKYVPDLRTLVKKITKKVPVVLHIHGKGILNRAVPNKENYRHSLLMNARLEDFYFTDYLEEEQAFSSVIRKDSVKEILEEFENAKVDVISFASGPFIAASLFQFVSQSAISVDHNRIQQEDGVIKTIEKSEDFTESFFIDSDQYSHDLVGGLALALNHFYPNEKVILPEETVVSEINLKEAKQKNIFYRFAAIMVGFFLLILMANYFYLNHLNAKIEENYLTLAEFEDQLSELSILNEEKERKEKLLSGSGLLSRSFLSFYLMEISNSVPADVILDQIVLRPLVDEIKGRHKIEFNERLVMVTGKTKSSNILDGWINDLKEEDWLASIDILDYTYKKNLGNFELELVLK